MNRLAAAFRRWGAPPFAASAADLSLAPLQSAEALNALLESVRTLRPLDAGRTRANLPSAGEFQSSALGRGLDLEEVRAYTPGDNVRDMDWRATARRGKPYVKVYRESRQNSLCLIVDRGAAMRFATRGYLKVVQAVRVAAAIAYAHADHGACIGGVLYDDQLTALRCRPGMQGAIEWTHLAVEPCPPMVKPTPNVSVGALYAAITGVAPRGAQLLWLSDFGHLSDDAKPWLAQLSQRYRIDALRIVDRAERILPNVGDAPFSSGAGDLHWIDTAARGVQAGFATAAETERTRIAGLFAGTGVFAAECTTEDDALTVAARMLAQRSGA